MLGRKQQGSLIYFFDAIKSALAESHDVTKISKLKDELNIALALMERDFPISIQVKLIIYVPYVHVHVPYVYIYIYIYILLKGK